MEQNIVEQASFLEMVTSSGPVVFSVLLTLIALSVLSWAVIIAKYLQIKKAKADSEEFRDIFFETKNFARIDDASRKLNSSPLVGIFASGYREVMSVIQGEDGALKGLREPDTDLEMVERALRRAQVDEAHRLESWVSFLATVASAAPFIGLFGTVIGIMNAFHGLAFAKDSTIQAVAPGISEALFATAVGLAAAIPATIAYNYFSVNLRKMKQTMDTFVQEFLVVARKSFLRM